MITYNIASLEELDILFSQYIKNVLGDSIDKVRISYQEYGQPTSQINENIAYVHVYPDQNVVNNYKERLETYNEQSDRIENLQHSMRVLAVSIIFYGPNSFTLSSVIHDSFTLEYGKEFLYKNNLALIPEETQNGLNLHEKINGRWWKRSDLKIKLYNSITVSESVDLIEEANIDYTLLSGSKTLHEGVVE